MVDELERRLADALAHDVDGYPVEVAGLVHGAQSGARRARRRRVTGAAALVALVLVSVPLGSSVLTGGADPQQVASTSVTPDPTPLDSAPLASTPRDSTPLASRGSGPAPSAALTSGPLPTSGPLLTSGPAPTASPVEPAPEPVPPTESPVNPDVPEGLAGTVLVPPDAVLAPTDLPFEPTTTQDTGPYVRVGTMVARPCGDGPEPGDELAVGGRQVLHYNDDGDAVESSVRVFEQGGAAQQLEFLRASLGVCDYPVVYVPADAAGLPGDEALIGTAPSNVLAGGTQVVGAVRDGDTTTGIRTDVDGDAAEATAAARDLLTRAHERLTASGLPAAHPG